MLERLKEEYNKILADIDKDINDEKTKIYMKQKISSFLDLFLAEIEEVIETSERKISILEDRQQDMENKMNKIQEVVEHIEQDIYDEGFDFEIICPYCDYQFVIDVDEEKTEVECPECQNIIELDWSGNLDDECGGSCSHCSGCGHDDFNYLNDNCEDDNNCDDDM